MPQKLNSVVSVIKSLGLSKITVILSISIVVITNASYHHWNDPHQIIESDVLQFYAYLPATLIHHDIEMEFVKKNPGYWSKYFWPVQLPNGKYTYFTTMGLSLMYSPFFIMVHYPMKWFGGDATGYSPPYKIALILSCLFYLSIGLFVLRRILLRYYSEIVAATTILLLVFATNLFYYVSDEPTMSHAYNFVLITCFLYFTILWSEKQTIGNSIALGLLTGLIALVRPTNVVIIVVLIFWNVAGWKDLSGRFMLFLRKYYLVLLMVLMSIVVWLPQMIYWKYVTGQYLFFSYGEKGKFFFDQPQVLNVLLSYRKGWLIYTPVMILAVYGFFFLWKANRKLFWPVLLYFLVNLYVVSSWWLWWYGGSFGMRALIDAYGVYSLALAAFSAWIFNHRSRIFQLAYFVVLAVFVYHNIFEIRQYHSGAIHYVSMTKEAYWDSFGRLNPSQRFIHLLVFPDYKLAETGVYPKPELDPMYIGKLSKEECIKRILLEMKSSKEILSDVRRKSLERNIPFDSMLNMDARYIYDYKVSKGIIPVRK